MDADPHVGTEAPFRQEVPLRDEIERRHRGPAQRAPPQAETMAGNAGRGVQRDVPGHEVARVDHRRHAIGRVHAQHRRIHVGIHRHQSQADFPVTGLRLHRQRQCQHGGHSPALGPRLIVFLLCRCHGQMRPCCPSFVRRNGATRQRQFYAGGAVRKIRMSTSGIEGFYSVPTVFGAHVPDARAQKKAAPRFRSAASIGESRASSGEHVGPDVLRPGQRELAFHFRRRG